MISRLGAKYGPVCLVLWEGAARAASYPDYTAIFVESFSKPFQVLVCQTWSA
ncbi:MAG: hypothetical protein HON76_02945 [Candidatus Scalindua sp.]|nr:hypothetical protein [Candidatus Scalindua sp.]